MTTSSLSEFSKKGSACLGAMASHELQVHISNDGSEQEGFAFTIQGLQVILIAQLVNAGWELGPAWLDLARPGVRRPKLWVPMGDDERARAG